MLKVDDDTDFVRKNDDAEKVLETKKEMLSNPEENKVDVGINDYNDDQKQLGNDDKTFQKNPFIQCVKRLENNGSLKHYMMTALSSTTTIGGTIDTTRAKKTAFDKYRLLAIFEYIYKSIHDVSNDNDDDAKKEKIEDGIIELITVFNLITVDEKKVFEDKMKVALETNYELHEKLDRMVKKQYRYCHGTKRRSSSQFDVSDDDESGPQHVDDDTFDEDGSNEVISFAGGVVSQENAQNTKLSATPITSPSTTYPRSRPKHHEKTSDECYGTNMELGCEVDPDIEEGKKGIPQECDTQEEEECLVDDGNISSPTQARLRDQGIEQLSMAPGAVDIPGPAIDCNNQIASAPEYQHRMPIGGDILSYAAANEQNQGFLVTAEIASLKDSAEFEARVQRRVALETENIETQVHRRILDTAVQADVYEDDTEEKIARIKRRWIICCAICFVIVVVASAALSTTLTRERTTEPPSSIPSLIPSVSPTSNLQNFLIDISPYSSVAFDDIDSPQSKALYWLENNHTDIQMMYTDQRILQRFSLATFYYSMNGDNWLNNTGWLRTNNNVDGTYDSLVDECNWYGIITDSTYNSQDSSSYRESSA